MATTPVSDTPTIILSESIECRPLSPDGCNRSIKSFSSTSTLDSIALEATAIAPPLPAMIDIKVVELHKQSINSAAPGWGIVLRGTTNELEMGLKIYTCHIETVLENGPAKVSYWALCLLIGMTSGIIFHAG